LPAVETSGLHPALLAGLAPGDAARLLRDARLHRYSRGDVVFHEGDRGDELHFIEEGLFAVRVTTERGDVAVLAVLVPGEVFGELALLRADSTRTATIVAVEAGTTRTVSREEFLDLRHAHPEVADELLTIVADKVARYTGRLMEALYVPAEQRVVRRLLELSDTYVATSGPGVDASTLHLRQDDLAGMAGTSRATVNRVLRREEQRGAITIGRGRLTVHDRDALEERT
jgi:CRP/FNR family cyclic AMP-dependent transcriptional regulator